MQWTWEASTEQDGYRGGHRDEWSLSWRSNAGWKTMKSATVKSVREWGGGGRWRKGPLGNTLAPLPRMEGTQVSCTWNDKLGTSAPSSPGCLHRQQPAWMWGFLTPRLTSPSCLTDSALEGGGRGGRGGPGCAHVSSLLHLPGSAVGLCPLIGAQDHRPRGNRSPAPGRHAVSKVVALPPRVGQGSRPRGRRPEGGCSAR